MGRSTTDAATIPPTRAPILPLESCDAAFVVGTLEFRVVEIGSGLWLPAEVRGNVRNKIVEKSRIVEPSRWCLDDCFTRGTICVSIRLCFVSSIDVQRLTLLQLRR